jgi:hypothetical protein
MRHQTAIYRILLGLTLIVLVFAACKREPKRSEYFEKVFKEKAGATFRGVDLGMPLNEIRKIEASSPKHDDQWGQVFEYGLGGKNKYFVEYLVRDPTAKTVSSIVSNILLEEKSAAADLFAEIEMHLRNRYGVADGTLGNLRWIDEEINLLVALRMLDDKKSISLSYGAIQSF